MRFCDLHTHSIFSDGTYTPTQLVDSAIENGISAIALCDHNTVDGLPEFLRAAKGKKMDAIPGAEFSVDYQGKELHLLGLYIDVDQFEKVAALMSEAVMRKEQSNIALAETLNGMGYCFDYMALKEKTPNGKINRAHLAAELTRLGYTESISCAFATVLAPEAGFYKEPKRITAFEMLSFLQSIHAVPVLAHPFLNLLEDELNIFLQQAKEFGLMGMECAYSLYDEKTTQKSLELAKKYELLPSGGSDFHGENKPDIKLGIGGGKLVVPYEWAERLKDLKG